MVRRAADAVARRNARWARLEPVLRHGPLREGTFTSPLHHPRVASALGIALGVAFVTCFLTGWLSHLIQHPAPWFDWPARPAGLYRITQGVHVATGIAAIPLLLAKLWVVTPRFWSWPPVAGIAHAVERVALIPLVGGSLLLLATGVVNIAGWYPWRFGFIQGHYAAAWITIGALVVHVGAKLPTVVTSLRRADTTAPGRQPPPGETAIGAADRARRDFLVATGAAAGLVTLVTVGQTVRPLRALAVLAPRDPAVGPQGFPVNRSAARARVTDLARDPAYRLVVEGDVTTPLSLSRTELAALPQTTAILPIACVEGWSATASWRGVPVRALLAAAGAPAGARVTVESLEPRGPYRRSALTAAHAHDPATLLALQVNGEPLDLEHGYPLRLIGPNRPGVMNTKWVGRLVVHA